MKCAHCGTQLINGCLYCNHCGKPVQIVPDYNEFDDYLDNLVGTSKTTNLSEVSSTLNSNYSNNINKEAEAKKINVQKQQRKRQQKKIIIISSIVFVIALTIFIIIIINFINSKNEQSFSYQIEKAQEAVEENDYKSAVEYYQKAIELDSNSIDARYSLADIYMKQKKNDSAMILYQEIIKLDKDSKDAYEKLISIYEQKKDYDSILELAESAKTLNNNSILDLFKDYIVDLPVSNESEGTYNEKTDIRLEASGDYTIFYTLNGDDPIEKGEEYKAPIVLSEEGDYTINAVCKNSKGIYSDVVTLKYRIKFDIPMEPVLSPDGGTFVAPGKITIHVDDGCSAYYTWDSTDPSVYSEKYSGPIDIPEGNNILSVISVNDSNKKCSDIYRARFEYYSQ